jgi:hypothetical protein
MNVLREMSQTTQEVVLKAAQNAVFTPGMNFTLYFSR